MTEFKKVSLNTPLSAIGESDSHAPNSRHWLSHCCYARLVRMLKNRFFSVTSATKP